LRVRRVAIPIGLVIFLLGLVWLLQGVDILPGSMMSGSQFWASAGALAVVVGLVMIGFGLAGKK